MLDDSQDFCGQKQVKRSKKSSTSGSSASSKKSVLVRIHSKWESATFVKKLRTILDESKSSSEKVSIIDFTGVNSPNKSLPGNVSTTSLSGGPVEQTDLEVDGGVSVLILTEPDYVGAGSGNNNLYKRRLAKFYSVKKGIESVVVCVRSPQTPPKDFCAVQTFAVIELGLAFIPVADNLDRHLPQVLAQLVWLNSKSAKDRKKPVQARKREEGSRSRRPFGSSFEHFGNCAWPRKRKGQNLACRIWQFKGHKRGRSSQPFKGCWAIDSVICVSLFPFGKQIGVVQSSK